MKDRNDYGMMSGGYIFDRMDRAAVTYVRKKAHLPKNAVLVTKNVNNLAFVRQLCNRRHKVIFSDYAKEYDGTYYVAVYLVDQDNLLIARGEFLFCEATNYCEVRL